MTHPSIKFNQSQRKSIHTHHSYRFPFSGLGVPDSGRPKRSGTREDGLDVPVITEVSVVIENELQQSNIEDLLEISHCFKLWLKLFPKVKFWRLNAKVKVLQTLVKSVNRPNTLTLTLMTDFPIEHLKWWRFAPVKILEKCMKCWRNSEIEMPTHVVPINMLSWVLLCLLLMLREVLSEVL